MLDPRAHPCRHRTRAEVKKRLFQECLVEVIQTNSDRRTVSHHAGNEVRRVVVQDRRVIPGNVWNHRSEHECREWKLPAPQPGDRDHGSDMGHSEWHSVMRFCAQRMSFGEKRES